MNKAVLEAIENTDFSVHAYHYQRPNFEAPWHYHPQFELVYIIEGRGTRYVGNHVAPFTEGDFVMIAPNVPHCWKTAPTHVGKSHSIVIQWMNNALAPLPEYRMLSSFLIQAQQGISFSSRLARQYYPTIAQVTSEKPLYRLVNFLALLEKLQQEKDFELLCTGQQSYRLNQTANDRLNKTYQYIESRFSQKISLADVAAELNMSSESFSRFFSRSMQKPFFSFLNQYRINKACTLLIDTDKSVADICFLCGFESLAFFHKQFKKQKNMTPLQFRKAFLRSIKQQS